MRNALRDAELPPPEHGWARLEAELRGVRPEASAGMAGTEGGRTTAARRPQWKIHVKRIAAAAAVVLLGVATVGFWLRSDRMVPSTDELLAEILSVPGTASDALPEGHAGEDPEETLRSRVAQAVSLPAGPSEAAGAQRNAAAQRTAGNAAEPRLALAVVKPQRPERSRPLMRRRRMPLPGNRSLCRSLLPPAARPGRPARSRPLPGPARNRDRPGRRLTGFMISPKPAGRRAGARRFRSRRAAAWPEAPGSVPEARLRCMPCSRLPRCPECPRRSATVPR